MIREVVRLVITEPQFSTYIIQHGDFYIPRRHPSSLPGSRDAQSSFLQALGCICAIHSAVLLAGPEPLSPFMFYSLLTGYVSDPHNWLASKLDPAKARQLEPWFRLTMSDAVPQGSEPINILLNSLDIDVCNFLNFNLISPWYFTSFFFGRAISFRVSELQHFMHFGQAR